MSKRPHALRFVVRVILCIVLATAVAAGSASALGGDCMQDPHLCWTCRYWGLFGLMCRDLPYGVHGDCGCWQEDFTSCVLYGNFCVAIIVY